MALTSAVLHTITMVACLHCAGVGHAIHVIVFRDRCPERLSGSFDSNVSSAIDLEADAVSLWPLSDDAQVLEIDRFKLKLFEAVRPVGVEVIDVAAAI